MALIDFSNLDDDDEFLLVFLTEDAGGVEGMDATKLADALENFASVVKLINASVNPGYAVEVRIDAVEPGSIRTAVRLIRREVGDILREPLKNIVLPVFIGYAFFTGDAPITIKVDDDFYVVERGRDRILLPRNVNEHVSTVAHSKSAEKAMRKFREASRSDRNVRGVAFGPPDRPIVLPLQDRDLSKPRLEPLVLPTDFETFRTTSLERQTLEILKIVLERGTRKWQFIWEGKKVSAAISDPTFYDKVDARDFVFGKGDVLICDLSIDQTFDASSRVYRDLNFVITRVHAVEAGSGQFKLPRP